MKTFKIDATSLFATTENGSGVYLSVVSKGLATLETKMKAKGAKNIKLRSTRGLFGMKFWLEGNLSK